MRKVILGALLLVLFTDSIGQQARPTRPLSREEYLLKSKRQKTAAWILLGGGLALLTVGGLTAPECNDYYGIIEECPFTFSDAMALTGILSAIGSIPLFIASKKNSRKGQAALTFLSMNKIPVLRAGAIRAQFCPSLSVRVDLP